MNSNQVQDILINLLYILVYSVSLISIGIVIVKSGKSAKKSPALHLFLLSFSLTGILLTAEMYIHNSPDNLQLYFNPAVPELVLNVLLLFSMTSAGFFIILLTNEYRKFSRSRMVFIISAVFLGLFLISESSFLIINSFAVNSLFAELYGYSVMAGFFLLLFISIICTVKLYMPLYQNTDKAGLEILRITLNFILISVTAYVITDSEVAVFIIPSGIIVVITLLILMMLYSGKKTESVSGLGTEELCRQYGLSARESEVALMLMHGRTYKEISSDLFISMSTVQTHVGRIYSKMQVGNKTELANRLRRP